MLPVLCQWDRQQQLWSTNEEAITTPTETLPSGTHMLTVIDDNDCTITIEVTIEEDTREPMVDL